MIRQTFVLFWTATHKMKSTTQSECMRFMWGACAALVRIEMCTLVLTRFYLRWIGAKQSYLPRRTRRENGCFDVVGVFPWPVLVPQRLSPRLACCYIDTTLNDTESIPVRTKIETDADGGRIEKRVLSRFIWWMRTRMQWMPLLRRSCIVVVNFSLTRASSTVCAFSSSYFFH